MRNLSRLLVTFLLLPCAVSAATLTGQVFGPDGLPVENARVGCRYEGPFVPGDERCVDRTDAEGRFQIDDVRPGKLVLGVKHRHLEPQWVNGIIIPSEGDPPPFRIELAQGAILEGYVLDSHGNPVPGASVYARLETQDPLWFPNGSSMDADVSGFYRILGLPAGPHRVIAISHELKLKSEETSLSVKDARHRLDFALPETVRVSGRAVGKFGEPLADVRVSLAPELGGYVFNVRTAADGSFEIDGVPAGEFRLRGQAPGLGETHPPLPVQVADQPVSDLTLRLVPGGLITGRILGVPPDDLKTVNLSLGATLFENGRRIVSVKGTVDENGVYRIVDVAPGRWLVHANWNNGDDVFEIPIEVTAAVRTVILDIETAED